jgi:uncharacterized protein (TIGR02217 family)
MPFPTWAFEFDLDAVQGSESYISSVVAQFMGIFLACGGQNGLFLFSDAQDNFVTAANSAMVDVTSGSTTPLSTIANGTSTVFQLARNIGGIVGALDLIQNVNGSINIYVNGTITTACTLSQSGLITFSTAPASGATLTWSGAFYFACRFDSDTIDATRTFTTNNGVDLWDMSSIKFDSEFVPDNTTVVVGAVASVPVIAPVVTPIAPPVVFIGGGGGSEIYVNGTLV